MNTTSTNQDRHSFSLAIANFTVQVNCNHRQLAERLQQRYKEFSARHAPDFTAEIQWVGKERASSLLDTETTFKNSVLQFAAPGYQGFIDEKIGQGELCLSSAQPVEDIDYYLRVVFALLAHAEDGILMHTAGIVRNGQTHLFFGHSGSGKTTACRVSANDYTILNDDLILLLPHEEGWLAHGTPFWNPTQIKPTNQSAPVAGMYLLIQSKKVFIRNIGGGQATAALISNVPVIPQDPVRSIRLLEILAQLRKTVPISELHFLPDNSFWNVIPE